MNSWKEAAANISSWRHRQSFLVTIFLKLAIELICKIVYTAPLKSKFSWLTGHRIWKLYNSKCNHLFLLSFRTISPIFILLAELWESQVCSLFLWNSFLAGGLDWFLSIEVSPPLAASTGGEPSLKMNQSSLHTGHEIRFKFSFRCTLLTFTIDISLATLYKNLLDTETERLELVQCVLSLDL